ncbi:MAG: protein kinase [Planctomycetota bacterium]
MRFRCPNCLQQIAVDLEKTPQSELTCPSCQSRISFAADEETVSYSYGDYPQIARYEVREHLGHGTFGDVFRAFDPDLEREIALKVPREERPSAGGTFLREAKMAAQISHPNVVTVHEIGIHNDNFFIASEFIDGTDLAKYLDSHQLESRQIAELMIKVLRGAHCFHEAGIVHRDLKPANILIDTNLEPFVADFGLARRDSGAEATVTRTGKLIGTPAYMSPEQARGQNRELTPRSDIFGCGVILYEMLTGSRPFKATDSRTVIHSILTDEPTPPRLIDKKISWELEAICLRAMEKDVGTRYESAKQMADDLENYLQGRPIVAKRLGPVRRSARWLKRNKTVAASFLAMSTALLLVTWQFAFASTSKRTPEYGGPAITPVLKHTVRIQCNVADEPFRLKKVQWAFARLDKQRVPDPENVVTLSGSQDTDATVELEPGEYLVVASIPGYGFHEVYRTVPEGVDSASGSTTPIKFQWQDDEVLLPPVLVKSTERAIQGMVAIPGGEYTTGEEGHVFVPIFTSEIDAFYLEATEVTYEDYTQVLKQPTLYLGEDAPPKGDFPVVGVKWFTAAHYAEAIGRRLMTELEWESVATNSGTTEFPWGNDPTQQPRWELRSVSAPTTDINQQGSIRGLFSNAAELTSSVIAPYPGGTMLPDPAARAALGAAFRGGPKDLRELEEDGTWNGYAKIRGSVQSRDSTHPNLGFRCARSLRPRFVDSPE